jgi:imidazolonepropionase-like amidohydrolase
MRRLVRCLTGAFPVSRNALAAFLLLACLPHTAAAQIETFTVVADGGTVGRLIATTTGNRTVVDYDYKNNGRGPTMAETLTVDRSGLPVQWTITGTTTFGSKVDERFVLEGNRARWTDSTGKGTANVDGTPLYVAQSASPWALGIYARALLADADRSLPALPSGTVRLDRLNALTLSGEAGTVEATAYALSGSDLNPDYFLLDADSRLAAVITTNLIVVRRGFEREASRLRGLATTLTTVRYADIHREVAHRFDDPVRIRNVRVFDPRTKSLSAPVSVVTHGKRIAGIQPVDSPPTPGEVIIDGGGGTLVPGMFEMHAHLGQTAALLNLAAGVTSVRDMGNSNANLDRLVAGIENGTLGGPRVTRSGFIEGRSPFNSNNGILVDSEAAAVEAVRWYGARGYWQIKIYNSIDPAWVPAMVREAHRLGMRVAGHVPAFATADDVIAAGYDEITHANQFMLGWVLKPGDDTRTLLRVTALRRFPDVDLTSDGVVKTIDAMAARKLVIDPTLTIHEALTHNRDGTVPPGAADYFDHMPIGYQRSEKQAMVDASEKRDDEAYRGAFDQVIATMKLLHERGVLIVPGTDLGGSFTYHRELELFQRLGMTPADVLARATLEMARYLGQEQQLGSIERGKLADFFLVAGDPTQDLKAIKKIRMVVKDGTVYFPSEIYPQFGIRPFADAPGVTPSRQP